MMDDNWLYYGDHFIMHKNIESLCCTPETNIILYVNYNSIRKLGSSQIFTTLTKLGIYVCVNMEWSLGYVSMSYC